MLEVKDIYKSFGEKQVLKGINLKLESGEVYGLIGKNGAGKTTLMNIISQLLCCDKGSVFVDGKQILSQNDLARKIAYIIDIPASFEYLTAKEDLELLLSASALKKEEKEERIKQCLKLVNLEGVENKKIKTFSRGMKQRFGICAGLVFNPQIVIMDEPSSALDPEGRKEVLNIIENMKKDGKTILLSTHILNDVERVCDRIGILIDGKIAIEGTTIDVLNSYSENIIVVECSADDAKVISQSLKSNKHIKDIIKTNIGVLIEHDGEDLKDLFVEVAKVGNNISSIHTKKMSLEDIFLTENKKGGLKNV